MMTMRHIACGLATVMGVAGPVAVQAEPVVVVELYTSQGCSSCPPADEYFATLAGDMTLMPLALHVDYWDYIGWKDTFAMASFGSRQRLYANLAGERTVYTPQMIVGGQDSIDGNNPKAVDALIRMHKKEKEPVGLDVERDGNILTILAAAKSDMAGPVDVAVVRYIPTEPVEIKRGENRGKTIEYRNIVTSWDVIGTWTGKEALAMQAAIDGTEAVVVILQEPGPARIVAAARP